MSDYASIDNEERREPESESEPGRSSPLDARHSHHKVFFFFLYFNCLIFNDSFFSNNVFIFGVVIMFQQVFWVMWF